MLYPTPRMHLLATMSLYGILSVVVAPASGPDSPFVSKPAQAAQYPVATNLVDLPLLGLDLVEGLLLVLALAVLVLLPVRPLPLEGLVLLLVEPVPAPLQLLARVQVAELPALLLLVANWEVPVLQVDLQPVFLMGVLEGELHWLLGLRQYATDMIVLDFLVWCPEYVSQEFVAIAQSKHLFEHATRLISL